MARKRAESPPRVPISLMVLTALELIGVQVKLFDFQSFFWHGGRFESVESTRFNQVDCWSKCFAQKSLSSKSAGVIRLDRRSHLMLLLNSRCLPDDSLSRELRTALPALQLTWTRTPNKTWLLTTTGKVCFSKTSFFHQKMNADLIGSHKDANHSKSKIPAVGRRDCIWWMACSKLAKSLQSRIETLRTLKLEAQSSEMRCFQRESFAISHCRRRRPSSGASLFQF